MNRIINFLALAVLTTFISCDDCEACFSPPVPFVFELINEQGDNIFTIESYTSDQLTIQDDTNQNYEFQFISENDLNLVSIGSIGWTSEEANLSFRLEEKEVFTFHVTANRVSEDCCSFTRYSDIAIEGANFELDNETGRYQILVE